MTRLGSLVFCIMLCTGLLGCGKDNGASSPKDPLEAIPLDNTVSGWTVDQKMNKTPGARAMSATDQTGVVGLIDGGGEYLFQGPSVPKEFLWQNYVNSTLPKAPQGAYLKLYILQMPSADAAKEFYTWLPQRSGTDYSRLVGTPNDWQPTSPTIGTVSRIQDNGSAWWINFCKGALYAEVTMDPSAGPAPDFTPSDVDLKNEAMRFAQKVAEKM